MGAGKIMSTESLQSKEFLAYLDEWQQNLEAKPISALAPEPHRASIVVVDMSEGFCHFGPLASSRVEAIIDPITALLKKAWKHGIHNILLAQDCHEPDAVEFGAFPPHCVIGTPEAETVAEIQQLPFFDRMDLITKNTLSSDINTGLHAWIASHPDIDTFIIVGDCTDLCIYQLAMYLQLDANARRLQRRVIVPAASVATYDRPVSAAREQGGFPHGGDLLNLVFLYHLALNGIEVIGRVG